MARPRKIIEQTAVDPTITDGEREVMEPPTAEVLDMLSKPPTNPIRITNLDADQRKLLLEDGIRKIFMAIGQMPQGGNIPSIIADDGSPIYNLVGYSQRENGPLTYTIIDADFRKVERAWQLYAQNEDSPTSAKYVAMLQRVVPTVKIFPRLAYTHLK